MGETLSDFIQQLQSLSILIHTIPIADSKHFPINSKEIKNIKESDQGSPYQKLWEESNSPVGVDEEEIEDLSKIAHQLTREGIIFENKSLAFAYKVKEMQLKPDPKEERLKEFFKERVQNKRKYVIKIPQFDRI